MIRLHRKQNAQRGFTLLEMLVVVLVISTVMALAAPKIGEEIAETRTQTIQREILRLGVQGRARAVGLGRAQVLSVDTGAGSVELWSGPSNRCDGIRWDILSGGGCADGNVWCVDQMRIDQINPAESDYRFEMRVCEDLGDFDDGICDAGPATFQVCWEPTGRAQFRSTWAEPWLDKPAGFEDQGGLIVGVQRYVTEGPVGAGRRVLVPFGGDVRVQR